MIREIVLIDAARWKLDPGFVWRGGDRRQLPYPIIALASQQGSSPQAISAVIKCIFRQKAEGEFAIPYPAHGGSNGFHG
jgi:hypothetical protein